MDYETTLKLVNAGYTKEEIEAMGAETGAKTTEPPTNEPNEKPNETKAIHASEVKPNEAKPKRETDPSGEIEALKESIAELNKTIVAMQSANIVNANGGKKPIDSVKETIDSFIKEF